jgi:lipoyl(octanoyl) transferase
VEAAAGLKPRVVRVRWLGRIAYDEALALQCEAAARVLRGEDESLLLLEHDPVITLGRNADAADLLAPPERLRELGIAVREANRGGKVTYHGPGQLVGYPILNLAPDRRDVKRFVTELEEVVIRTLEELGIRAGRSDRRDRVTSVWVGNEKIAAIGVHLSRWITTHGFALNVTDEALLHFSAIVPCGITDGGVTSVERQIRRRIAPRELVPRIAEHFGALFGREIMRT